MLNLDIGTILWQAFNFLVFAGALYYLLFRPMSRGIKARAEEKEQLLRDLHTDREAAAALQTELTARLESAEEEAEVLVAEAQNKAELDRIALLQEAQVEIERILAKAQVDVHRLKTQAVNEFHEDLLKAVLDVSGLVVGQVAPDAVQDGLVKQLFDSVWELGRSDMQRVDVLRRSLGERTPTVVARTAKLLAPEQQGQLVRTFTALADRNINLDLKVDPILGLGLRVRIGDLVMDNTVAGKLEGLRVDVMDALKERLANE